MATPERDLAASPADVWLARLLVVAGTGVGLASFTPVVAGSSWWWTAMIGVAAVCLTGAVLRTIGMGLPSSTVAAVVAVLTVCWVFVPSTLWFVLPTPDSVRALADQYDAAWLVIVEQPAPVPGSTDVAMVLALAAVVVAVLADAVVDSRHGVLAVGGLWTALLVTPSVVLGDLPSAWWFVALAVPWLALLGAARSDAGALAAWRRPAAVLVAGAAVLASAVGPGVLPDVSAVASSWNRPSAQVFGTGINPMIELGRSLRRGAPVTALEYTTTLSAPPYLKVATLSEFGGRTWSPDEPDRDAPMEGEVVLSSDVERTVETTQVEIVNLRSSMLPVPYPVLTVDGLEGDWAIERGGLTVRADGDDTRGERYIARSLDVDPTAEQLRRAPPPVTVEERVFELPAERPAVLAATAEAVTSGAESDYDRALALQDYLRGPDFVYSEEAPIREGFDGNGLQALEQFLARKAGYCVHFSSAMAVMARELGMPARVAVGYAPGRSVGSRDGESVYAVTSHDLHAWTEIYFQGAGWIRFEPTPGIGRATRFVEPITQGDLAGGALPETALDPDADAAADLAAADEGAAERPSVLRSLAALGVVVALGLLPAVLRIVRRRRRLRAGTPGGVWREVLDTAVDLGIALPPTGTPRQVADLLAARVAGGTVPAVGALRDAVEAAWFSRDDPDPVPPGEAAWVLGDLRRSVSRLARVRAVLLPRTLLVSRDRAVSTSPRDRARPARSSSG